MTGGTSRNNSDLSLTPPWKFLETRPAGSEIFYKYAKIE